MALFSTAFTHDASSPFARAHGDLLQPTAWHSDATFLIDARAKRSMLWFSFLFVRTGQDETLCCTVVWQRILRRTALRLDSRDRGQGEEVADRSLPSQQCGFTSYVSLRRSHFLSPRCVLAKIINLSELNLHTLLVSIVECFCQFKKMKTFG